MRLTDRVRGAVAGWFGGPAAAAMHEVGSAVAETFEPAADLPLYEPLTSRTDAATALVAQRREAVERMEAGAVARESITLGSGMNLDSDDHLYRRLTNGAKFSTRDLSPLAQDRMLEMCWYLWERNGFARRLITLMTDLIIGEGLQVEAGDERVQEVINNTWNHRGNKVNTRLRQFHNALSLNGELILPVAVNPFTGIPVFGYIEPYQVKNVLPDPENVLIPDKLVLKGEGGHPGKTLQIVREDANGELHGEVFYFAINTLPNSLRGRSDLMPLADWLDLYDQYLFGEIERLYLLSSFVWDWTIEGADDDQIREKLKKFPKPKPGKVWAHNEKEKLEAQTPDLKAQDRTEAGRMLRVHIAGAFGFPLSYLGDTESNRATIEGQNDVMMKTPAARQKEFGGFISQLVRFAIEQTREKNRALFVNSDPGYVVKMPEIQAKDVTRVGTVLSGVASALDTGMANGTVSKKVAAATTAAIIRHLGVDVDPTEMLEDARQEKEEADAAADERHADLVAQGLVPGKGAAGKRNPPVPADDDAEDE
jgi:hypothetical protein